MSGIARRMPASVRKWLHSIGSVAASSIRASRNRRESRRLFLINRAERNATTPSQASISDAEMLRLVSW